MRTFAIISVQFSEKNIVDVLLGLKVTLYKLDLTCEVRHEEENV